MIGWLHRWLRQSPTPLFVAGLLATWEVTVRVAGVSDTVLPPPAQVIGEVGSRMSFYWEHTLFTLQSIGAGLAMALLFSCVLALVIAQVPRVGNALYPLLIASQAVPAIAVAPFLVMRFGHGLMSKMVIVTLISFFPLTVSISRGLVDVDRDTVNLMRAFGAGRLAILLRVRIPNALPYIFAGLKIAVVLATIGAVVAEWVGSLRGLGYVILTASEQLSAELTFGAVAVTCTLGLILYGVTLFVERLAMPWK